ncbi:protein LOW PSII ACCUMULATION 2 chloroplastic [Tripterygium wilfordii]|uniref:Protein LOW PSII ACCUMULATION 2 chloroplastic n=1 Tax=Tripterygium wilfordii TaxID=458696 RepID=A0A7J7CAH2_TRIWF|nr:protein LOW PSII ACCUMULATION 2, chloroplastic [Tripterygium wilfordii]KAF5731090.1 protein LOW PSII ACCUMULATION 2 chloroplastic [Tripterygium wilfordii]
MALQIHSPSASFTTIKPYHFLKSPVFFSSTKPKFIVNSEKPAIDDPKASNESAPPKKPTSPGLGFGSSPSPIANPVSGKKKQKNKGNERASVIRRLPIEKPAVMSPEDKEKAKEQRTNENAFLLAWLGLGAVILVEGIVLAASGFLPEEWDKFLVKFLYPSFTPTVGLFVAGTVTYGVSKYLQNEKLKDQK